MSHHFFSAFVLSLFSFLVGFISYVVYQHSTRLLRRAFLVVPLAFLGFFLTDGLSFDNSNPLAYFNLYLEIIGYSIIAGCVAYLFSIRNNSSLTLN